jgi:hypothetical protein
MLKATVFTVKKVRCSPASPSDWYNARFITTTSTGDAPALVWLIAIQPNGDGVIEHVEEAEGY